jgi:hypothetical protein
VIWTFERGDEVVRVETRIDNATGEYVIVGTWAGGRSETERFQDPAQFEARILALEAQLAADNWSLVGSPNILSDGWRGPQSH